MISMKKTPSWKTCSDSVPRGEGVAVVDVVALVVPGDHPEVVEGAPGGPLPGQGLVIARSIAHNHLVRMAVNKSRMIFYSDGFLELWNKDEVVVEKLVCMHKKKIILRFLVKVPSKVNFYDHGPSNHQIIALSCTKQPINSCLRV